VQRRYLELQATQPNITLDEVKENLLMRDRIDSTREISPLKQASDAIVLDNSKLTREEQLQIALNWVKERTN
jgi:cytidylate kinase